MTADHRRRVVLGVSGGIAAYKACSIVRKLAEAGHDVQVVPTTSALQFVGAATWAALSGNAVTDDLFHDVHDVPHVHWGQTADLVLVAPATANTIAKIAHGLADDLLTATVLTAKCPVLVAPAMHTEMWENPATVANVQTLTDRGIMVVPPAVGRLTGADSGQGRLPQPEALSALAQSALVRPGEQDLPSQRVLVTAGGTREPLDPVRYLGNRSSGKMGCALAAAAWVRGAEVTLVGANLEVEPPAGVDVVSVTTAQEMADAVAKYRDDQDIVVMAAAVADYRPERAEYKIKKSADDLSLPLAPTPDILRDLVTWRTDRGQPGPKLVGFAAETGSESSTPLTLAKEKLARKQCDYLVLNDVSGDVFGADTNTVTVLTRDGTNLGIPAGSKTAIAQQILSAIIGGGAPAD